MRRLAYLIFIGISLTTWALGQQNPYGRIIGRVTDSSGAVVPNATVQSTNVDTNVKASAATNGEGNFDLPNLNPGQYKLKVEANGFKASDLGPLQLKVGDVLNLPIMLQIGAAGETVTVTSEAPQLDTASANVGQVIDHRDVMNLPLPGANPGYLLQLLPNVITTNPPGATWTPDGQDQPSAAVTAGTNGSNTEFALDGVPNMMWRGTMAVVPPPEMVEEFKVETGSYDASQGRAIGAHVNMVMKSGTNQFHGVLVYSNLNRDLTTHPFFVNRSLYDLSTGPPTAAKANSLWPGRNVNRYRGTMGGPIYVPKVYDGRNRTFWQFGFDFMRMPYPDIGFWTVPTAKERGGDFSDLLALGAQYQIYDPYSTVPAGNGIYGRSPLPGNVIPASRISPLASQILGLYPLPNATGTTTGLNNYTGAPNQNVNYNSEYIRVDQNFGEKQRLFFSYNQNDMAARYSNIFAGAAAPYEGTIFDGWWHRFGVSDSVTLSPTMVLTLRASVQRFTYINGAASVPYNLSQLGLPQSLLSQLDSRYTTFPGISLGNFQGIGGGGYEYQGQTFPTFFASVSKVQGNHTVSAGMDYRIYEVGDNARGNVSPSYSFGSTWTLGPTSTSSAAPVGQDLASFLYGLPSSGSIDRNGSYQMSSKYLAPFVQDDWKVTPRLTLNLGLRWEVEIPSTERYNRENRGFDFTTPNPISAAALANYTANPIPQVSPSAFKTLGGLLFAGVGGVPRDMWSTQLHNFLPRAGFSYQLRPNTVVRGGYGVFFNTIGADMIPVSLTGFSQSTTLIASTDNGQTYQGTLANPFPNGLVTAPGASLGLQTNLGNSITIVNPDMREALDQRWNLDVQRQLRGGVLVDIGYTGNRAYHLPYTVNLDSVPQQYMSTSPFRDQTTINTLGTSVANPFYNIPQFSGTSLATATVPVSQLLKPYPQYSGLSMSSYNGYSWYHGFSAHVERRFSHGFTAQASYTWSKYMQAVETLNSFDMLPTHSISQNDRPQHFVANGIFELPFGKGHAFLSSASGWINQIVGGWTASVIYTAQTGAPVSFSNVAYYGTLQQLVLGRGQRIVGEWFNTANFATAASQQLASNVRTFPLRLTGLRAPGINDWDMSLVKNFRIRERTSFELRAEAVDLANHPQFASPNTSPTSTLFGQVTSTVGFYQRAVTVSARLNF